GAGRTIGACQCASPRPGISPRPPPAMIWVSARRSVGIGLVEIFSMMLPLIRMLDGAESEGCVPSNIRTFSKMVTAERSCACADAAQIVAAAMAPCASLWKARRVGALMFPPLVLSLSADEVRDTPAGDNDQDLPSSTPGFSRLKVSDCSS